MTLRETVNNAHSHWMDADGPESEIIISSRVRVARNLAGIPFPHLLNKENSEKVIHAVRLAISNKEASELLGGLELSSLGELSPLERQILVDKHLISPDLLNDFQRKAVVLREDEVVSIMVNEEDHLRIQCILPGLQLKEAWDVVNRVDDGLEKTLDYAFSEKVGYLTSCPTNVGTGMRASVMIHLPGLKLAKQLAGVLNAINKLGLTVRGLYGEGTEALGDLFQISNQITLGQSEEEIINNLISIARQILAQEQAARRNLYKDRREVIEDRVFRAFGALKYARILSSEEAMRLFSDLRLGVEMKIISGIPVRLLNELMVKIRPAFITKMAGRELTPYQRDIFRAGLIRREFANLPV
ncbi:MAG: protein arginine kinase [Pelotomaculum sp.]|uniref:Protein-arginine kinase n=1 Tax=Pelotomaculum thermopropionicum (strain DSM 13744 / JCM 10971 / SI) TaxID=370438 RepID=MCSB_PELTS|nr:RecName: Full=Protein-arginine kinase [Pelotomaculum thermopropionicum SI]NPV74166.1 protein arginine kinase [Pelotomaculum sp.]BAF58463.1 argininekinase [Pelotomaculum thermopropionicum SI]